MLSKEDLLVSAFYELDYLLCIGVVLPNFFKKKLFVLLLHHVLGVIRIDVLKKSCSRVNLAFACKNS
jgi:hypothetical protein